MIQTSPSINGFLVIDKPAGITSREAVDHVQHWFPQTKLGHAGTLDPSATGVLVIGVGTSGTRFIEYIQDQEKTYLTTIRLGATSTTDDVEGDITENSNVTAPNEMQLRGALQSFIGTISQRPPAYSAAWVNGVRAHTKARRGQEVNLKPRTITIHEINLLRFEYPEVDVRIHCSKGTYIRSIARDLGEKLGLGGYVLKLRRTSIGNITCDQAVTLDSSAEDAEQALLPMSIASSQLFRCDVSEDDARRMIHGLKLKGPRALPAGIVALWQNDVFFGVGRYDDVDLVLRPVKMLAY